MVGLKGGQVSLRIAQQRREHLALLAGAVGAAQNGIEMVAQLLVEHIQDRREVGSRQPVSVEVDRALGVSTESAMQRRIREQLDRRQVRRQPEGQAAADGDERIRWRLQLQGSDSRADQVTAVGRQGQLLPPALKQARQVSESVAIHCGSAGSSQSVYTSGCDFCQSKQHGHDGF